MEKDTSGHKLWHCSGLTLLGGSDKSAEGKATGSLMSLQGLGHELAQTLLV